MLAYLLCSTSTDYPSVQYNQIWGQVDQHCCRHPVGPDKTGDDSSLSLLWNMKIDIRKSETTSTEVHGAAKG